MLYVLCYALCDVLCSMCCAMLYVMRCAVGWAALVSVCMLCALIPLETALARRAKAYRRQVGGGVLYYYYYYFDPWNMHTLICLLL
jgi:hypothetical protein